MPHLSELHGAATHLAVIAIPVYVLVLLVRRRLGRRVAAPRPSRGWSAPRSPARCWPARPACSCGGRRRQTLRGSSLRVGTVHFWLGIALTLMTLVLVAWRFRRAQTDRHTHGLELLAGGLIALVAVFAQGYLGGRMTYNSAVGVDDGGQLAQSASAPSSSTSRWPRACRPAQAGQAFSSAGSAARAATASWPRATAARGSPAARPRGVPPRARARPVPAAVVTDRDFAAIDAYLRTLGG